MSLITRRTALQAALMAGAASCSRPKTKTPFAASEKAASGLFAHGVASGDPASDSVVLWTRLSPPPSDDAGVQYEVAWEVASDPDFKAIVVTGSATTSAARDNTVKAIADGLEPGKNYYYRFVSGADAVSPVGRTKTLPSGALDAAKFAVLTCSNYPFGYFNVYDLVSRRDDLDAVIHLGDYIYEYGPDGYGGEEGAKLGRPHDPPHEILTLDDYRRRHAQYKADPSTQAMHAAHPMIAIWDDHEVADNSWAGGAENHQPATEGDWGARERAAMQAYFEWMPIREPDPDQPRAAIFRSFSYGDLLTIVALESRLLARSAEINYDDIAARLKTKDDAARFIKDVLGDPSRRLLGQPQEEFIAKALKASVASGQPWRVIANQVIMAKVTAPDLNPHVTEKDIEELQAQWSQARSFIKTSALGLPMDFDAWNGYPAARERFYKTTREAGAQGLVVVTGDSHTWWANDLVAEDGAHMGVELGVHSVTSPSPFRREFLGGKGADYALLTNQDNKCVRYLSGENHGYISLEIGREAVDARFVAVDTIESPNYNAFDQVSFKIKKAKDGVRFADMKGGSFKEEMLF
ncbi:MAG TPA: alkaline phosphatase D family protein [Parvularculaceae bacterium]|nr:alkaline phosphatase D family protein [Parvularculaceae bacterium]